jgi:circadian clock protein KaiC
MLCGGAGCGKTMLAMEFLVRGATQFHEPGVFLSFEETEKELGQNVASLGFNLPALCRRKKIAFDYVRIERSELEETGEYNLEALFVRMGRAIDAVGAKRVVLDTLEALLSGLSNIAILRAEIRRLFQWLKRKGVTAVITAESGEKKLTRNGLEEYVSDCVILLDHRVQNQNTVRRLRVIKYRGSMHGTNEYPFVIQENGFCVLPLSSLELRHPASTGRISSGLPGLDDMLGGKGFFRGSSVLVSGGAGTGKTSVAAHFAHTACRQGERALYIATEQSPREIMRNTQSIGLDLGQWFKNGRLKFHAVRPMRYGLEKHLAVIDDLVMQVRPSVVVVDPITNFDCMGDSAEVTSLMARLIDLFKSHTITAMFIGLTGGDSFSESSNVGVSSQMDTWLLLRNLESNGERNRGLQILKSRGMAHSNQIREFLLTDNGIRLQDIYVGPSGLLAGAARAAQEARERAEASARKHAVAQKRSELQLKRKQLESHIASLRAQFAIEQQGILGESMELNQIQAQNIEDRVQMARVRKADVEGPVNGHRSQVAGR